jgi:hypothetical protein
MFIIYRELCALADAAQEAAARRIAGVVSEA